jgi:N6-adenosine-specific RNA methylase IME4
MLKEVERAAAPFDCFPADHYGVIEADPAWQFLARSDKGKGRSPEKHYGCMSIDDIKALPVKSLAAPDCVLFLWVTDPLLPVGLEVMAAWGFTFKTVGFTWAKLQKKELGPVWTEDSFFTGMGYWSRANTEMCLLGTIGKPKRQGRGVKRLIVAPRREHSRKPDESFVRMRRLAPGPAIELFSRENRPGWSAWGNESGKFSNEQASPSVSDDRPTQYQMFSEV